ncbi:hypothetical protein [Cellulomonas sp. ATA003]|uniref:hypothetical protein n=1 Tax=Cellulomonas sp. ATA003 TaxID=3073064 RepID=UPI002872E0DD|nr:hypothetical protein [Cellulomonas sp. ATA003]WNB84330.1 hypothetical protein REH70_10585 [Cellulomonas sp. ATA003]
MVPRRHQPSDKEIVQAVAAVPPPSAVPPDEPEIYPDGLLVVQRSHLSRDRPPEGVHVVYRKALVKWLERQPAMLDPGAVERIFAAARRSTTWQTAITRR